MVNKPCGQGEYIAGTDFFMLLDVPGYNPEPYQVVQATWQAY
jgi:hypothetical protein